jgi:PAS domain S-box-containing protein
MMMNTNRKNELRELEILKRAVENTNEAFVTIDESHKVIFFNKAAESIFGYRRQEVVGHDLSVIMAPTCSQDHRAAVARYIETKVPRRIGHVTELLATRKSGEQFPATISFSVTQLKGRFYFTGIIRDTTEKHTLQDRVLQAERLAAIGQLVAEITHEIKNPLMMIGGFVRQLIRAPDEKKNIKKLSIIEDEVKRLEALLSDLRELYVPQVVSDEPVNINELLKQSVALIRPDCEKARIRVSFSVDERMRPVGGDRAKLEQVFLNLMKNAIDAMGKGGRLSVKTRVKGNLVEISVADNGCGISSENQEKVFSPFFTTKKHGTGLGLCISKRIIEAHEGGGLSVESQESKGTTFRITLPFMTQDADEWSSKSS